MCCRLLGSGPDAGSATYHIETLPHSLLYDLAVHPLEQYLVTTGQDGLLRQWDVTTGALQRTLAPEAGAGWFCWQSVLVAVNSVTMMTTCP